ncbi:MAG: glycosyltransferase involved in cell wall biosynthesis [Limisphaerales bacterium]|jgi:glycosyltransferase involved in cell wall biosynthesis
MRLALLTHEPFYPPTGGGSAEAVYLVGELIRRSHEVHLFCPDFPDRDDVAKRFGVTVHPFTGWEMGRHTRLRSLKYLAYPGALRRLVRRAARDISFDAILSQHAISAVAAGRLKADLGVPMVMNFLDFLTGFMESWPAWAMPRLVLRRLMAYELSLPKRHDADAVLTVSDELARRFAETGYDSDRLQTIHYGHDAKLFQPRTENREPGTENRGTVAMHGSFDTHHLGPIAVRAIADIALAKPETHFLFIGRETDAVKNLAKRVLAAAPSAKLECTGFVPYGEVAGRLGQAGVGIIPYESSSGAHCAFVAKLVEYAALGLPVVSTPLTGVMAFFGGEPSVRFSAFDGSQFANDVIDLLDNPPPRADTERLAKRVAAELDWPVICAKAVDRLESVVS